MHSLHSRRFIQLCTPTEDIICVCTRRRKSPQHPAATYKLALTSTFLARIGNVAVLEFICRLTCATLHPISQVPSKLRYTGRQSNLTAAHHTLCIVTCQSHSYSPPRHGWLNVILKSAKLLLPKYLFISGTPTTGCSRDCIVIDQRRFRFFL